MQNFTIASSDNTIDTLKSAFKLTVDKFREC